MHDPKTAHIVVMGGSREQVAREPAQVSRIEGGAGARAGQGDGVRVGDSRVILDIKQDKLIILVIWIGHRRNIYKSG